MHGFSDISDQALGCAEEFIWKLLDNNHSEEGVFELNALFKERPCVYEVYCNYAQLHASLVLHHNKPTEGIDCWRGFCNFHLV